MSDGLMNSSSIDRYVDRILEERAALRAAADRLAEAVEEAKLTADYAIGGLLLDRNALSYISEKAETALKAYREVAGD